MTYAPRGPASSTPADHGFAVERVYEPVDDAGDVDARRRRHLDDQGRRAGARAPDHGRPEPALPRRARRSAARRPRAAQPGAGGHRARSRRTRRPRAARPLLVVVPAPGTSTRTCATSASRPSPRCCGRAPKTASIVALRSKASKYGTSVFWAAGSKPSRGRAPRAPRPARVLGVRRRRAQHEELEVARRHALPGREGQEDDAPVAGVDVVAGELFVGQRADHGQAAAGACPRRRVA